MAKGYIGIGGVAKNVKNIYIGVGGVAKQVKKAYIGVGGVAKLWYQKEPPYGQLLQLFGNVSYSDVVGLNEANAGDVYKDYAANTSGTYYAFVFYGSYLYISKIVFSGNSTAPTETGLNHNMGNLWISISQTPGASGLVWRVKSMYGPGNNPTSGGTLAVLQFANSGFSEAEIDSILSDNVIYSPFDGDEPGGLYVAGNTSNTARTMEVYPPYLYTANMPYFVAIGSNLAFNAGRKPKFSTAAPFLTYEERMFVKFTEVTESLKAAIGGSVVSVYRGSIIGFRMS